MTRTYLIEAAIDPLDLEDEAIMTAIEDNEIPLSTSITDGLYTVSAEVEAENPVQAASSFRSACTQCGLNVVRYLNDLVTIKAIADRTTVSPEAVRLWSQGTRAANFPAPYQIAGNQSLWAWFDVYQWVKSRDTPRCAIIDLFDTEPLAPTQIESLNSQLSQMSTDHSADGVVDATGRFGQWTHTGNSTSATWTPDRRPIKTIQPEQAHA